MLILYGFVWAGRLDWNLPPWARTLTGRDAIPHVREGFEIAPQRVVPVVLNVEVPKEIDAPLGGGQGDETLYGHWRLVKDPPADGDPPPAEGAESAALRTAVATPEPLRVCIAAP